MYAVLAAAALVTLASIYHLIRQAFSDDSTRIIDGKVVRLPPGPRQLPIIGNIGQLDPERQHPQFLKWAQQYGDIYRVRFGSSNIIVLNTPEAATDLFERRSAIYSSRNGPHFAHDLMSAGQRMVFLPYGPEWKAARTSIHPFLMGSKSDTYKIVQEHESAILMGDLARHTRHLAERKRRGLQLNDEPLTHETGWEAHVRRYTTSVVMNITYGRRVTTAYNNPSLHKIYDVLANFTRVGQPGRNLCDVFPVLRKLPDWLAPWRRRALELHRWEMQLWGGLLEEAKAARRNLTAGQHGYVHAALAARDASSDGDGEASAESIPGVGLDKNGQMSDVLLAYTAATILEAGSDSTATAVYFFVLACLNDASILTKLRAEIDSAVPRTELPKYSQVAALPYLRACVKETLRRRPPAIMGVPHSVARDDVYAGYLIPRGSTVIGNVWAMHMDARRYPHPEKFMPERFMSGGEDDDAVSASAATTAMAKDRQSRERERGHYAFGWGRRICQGMHIAENSLLIIFARLAWAFDLVPEPEGEGEGEGGGGGGGGGEGTGRAPIPDINDEEGTFLPGFVSQPRAFPCGFLPRDGAVQKVLDAAYDEAQAFWAESELEGDERGGYYREEGQGEGKRE